MPGEGDGTKEGDHQKKIRNEEGVTRINRHRSGGYLFLLA